MSTIETTTTQDNNHQYQAAYDATASDRAALSPNDLLLVNLDVPLAVTTVLGAMPKMKIIRAEAATKLPADIVEHIDHAETYARALGYAQTVFLAASRPTEILPELAERAFKLRDLLLTDAKALAQRGMLDAKPLTDLKGGPGYLNIASDLGVLVRMLRERWSTVATKTAIQPAELDEAEHIFEQITDAYAGRNRQSDEVAAMSDDGQRAFTLLVKTYDQVRRAATFLRWDMNDADKFTPSLWAGRGTRTDLTTKPEAPATAAAPTNPTTPPPAPSAPSAPVGHPGSSPFADN
jgi:hypothetical protein